jgi:hypothetical protein
MSFFGPDPKETCPGSYYMGCILGGSSNSQLPLKFRKTMTVVTSATAMGNCIK